MNVKVGLGGKIRIMGPLFRWLFPKDVVAVTLCPFGIYIRHGVDAKNELIIQHELIHWRQQLELLIIPFYIWYSIGSLIKGYNKVSFEREAYEQEGVEGYLKNREPYAFLRYI